MKTEFGEYEKYKGDVWISKQDKKLETQGTNIALLENGKLRVLGYVIRKGDQWTHTHSKFYSLEEIVWSVLKSYGWYDQVCRRMLGETLTIEQILEKYTKGDYHTKLTLPTETEVSTDYIFDSEKTASWNLQRVQEHNEQIQSQRKVVLEDEQRLIGILREDIVTALMEQFKFTRKQAEVIEARSYDQRFSSLYYYIELMDSEAEYARKLITI